MKRPSKPGPTEGKNATGSYYRPAADNSLTAEHHQTRPTPQGGLLQPERHIHITSHELAEQLSRQSPEAQAQAAIALAFCKECRGWKDARIINDWGYPYISESVTKKLATTKIRPYERHFHYTQLDRVMEAVREWLASDPITREHDRAAAARSMHDASARYFDGLLDQADFGRELMAACVKANRGRKGPAGA